MDHTQVLSVLAGSIGFGVLLGIALVLLSSIER